MIKKSVVDAPLVKEVYQKWLQEVLLLPKGKALLLEGLRLKEALRLKSAGWRFAKYRSKLEPDGKEGLVRLYLFRSGLGLVERR